MRTANGLFIWNSLNEGAVALITPAYYSTAPTAIFGYVSVIRNPLETVTVGDENITLPILSKAVFL